MKAQPSTSEIVAALRSVRVSELQRAILQANYLAPDRTISIEELAVAVKHDQPQLPYGILARRVCKKLEFVPRMTLRSGKPVWTAVFADSPGDRSSSSWQWKLKGSVAKALERLKWVDPGEKTNAFILLWNPAQWEWDPRRYRAAVRKTAAGQSVLDRWSSGNRKAIEPGDRLYLFRQGRDRGLIASGYAASTPKSVKGAPRKLYLRVQFDRLVRVEDRLDVEQLLDADLEVPWNNLYASGVQVPRTSRTGLETLWKQRLHSLGQRTLSAQSAGGEIDSDEEFLEGNEFFRVHRARERSIALVNRVKAKAMREGRLHCQICAFDFVKSYGELGEGFIECHHAVPLSEYKSNRKTRMADLALVCSNCHRMLHRSRDWLTIDELRSRLIRR